MIAEIKKLVKGIGRPVRLMEVCGTHTVSIFRHGIRGLLPEGLGLISGPGCPVCVTPAGDVDNAISLSMTEGVLLATFGDMMRVPGSGRSLGEARAEGAQVEVVYSPMDALKIAQKEKALPWAFGKVVFFATGFETTSPLVAATVMEASARGVKNFYIYPAHKLIPPALRALLSSGEVLIDGFILPGHVSTIIGMAPYEFIAREFGRPGVITGFDGKDILEGILMLLRQIAGGRAEIEIEYRTVVREEGNPKAVSMINECFEPVDADWRGIGVIPKSGLRLREKFRDFDAAKNFRIADSGMQGRKAPYGVAVPLAAGRARPCSCGEILRGVKTPPECPLFALTCTPETPVGPCMVSDEGTCAAYYKYRGAYG